jgi:penicillin-binding protein 1A
MSILRYAQQHLSVLGAKASAMADRIASTRTARRLRPLSGLANAAIILGIALIGFAATFTEPLYQQYPLESTLRGAEKRPLILIGADGKPFAERGDCVAEPVTIAELPPHLIHALLAMEDRRFYGHVGLDPKGIARAMLRNHRAGRTIEGGSTITQQLVKMSFLSSARTMDRKIDEAMLAAWLELRMSKDEILTRYLSSAYFGEGCFGVRAAAKHFFNKPVGEMSVSEAALLVALLRSPTQLTRNFDDAKARAELVMKSMVRDGTLDAASLASVPPPQLNPARGEEFGSEYADWLADSLQGQIADAHSRQPLAVQTAFEPALQQVAEDAVKTILDKRGKRMRASQAAVVIMRTDGRVVAMVGGRARAAGQFNRAVQARRQPGSAFKTFVYLAALRAGVRTEMYVSDEPVSIDGWEPKNYDNSFHGTVSLETAFASSINTVAVKLTEAAGRESVIAAARDLGITSPLVPNASIALGTSEVNLLELTSSYASIAAGAYPVRPWGAVGFDGVVANGGEPPRESGAWRLTQAGDLRELMSGVVEHGSGIAASLPIPAYGKTGTNQDYRDAWFIGFTGNLVAGVWVGNDDFSPMRTVTGGTLPAEIWRKIMIAAMKTDPRFERKLPKIAVFEARAREPEELPQTLASFDDGYVRGASSTTSTAEASMFGQTLTRGRVYEMPAGEDNGGWNNGGSRRESSTREFSKRLRDMGWPGE